MIVALAGGVGGAKLAYGLDAAFPNELLTVVVNTADDFLWHGLKVCPDLDTVMYTLGGWANTATGWGVADDTHTALSMLATYGQDPWFTIGDRDLATHVLRTDVLRRGGTLTEATAVLARALGVRPHLLPMTDDVVETLIETPDGDLEFQEYFVRRRHEPLVTGVRFRGIESARPAREVVAALEAADLIVLCPSNPIVSIGPILATPGMRDALAAARAPVVAVSPIVGGRALRGPADHMLDSLGHESSALGVARLYAGVIKGMVIDERDVSLAPEIEALDIRVLATQSVMHDDADRRALARATVEFGYTLRRMQASPA